MPILSRLDPEQLLERGLADRLEISARPRPTPRQVFGVWLENIGAGLGVSVFVGVGLFAVQAPESVLWSGAVFSGAAVFGGLMFIRGSSDEYATWKNTRQIRQAWKALEKDYKAKHERMHAQLNRALDEIDVMEIEIGELRRALDRMTTERDSAILEKKRALEQAQAANNRNFVRASNTSAQVVTDAHEMLRYWFQSNGEKWYSRNVANSFGWSDKRHRAAQQLLVDSGVVVINEKRPRVMEETIDAALRVLNDHVARVDSVYVPDARQSNWDGDDA